MSDDDPDLQFQLDRISSNYSSRPPRTNLAGIRTIPWLDPNARSASRTLIASWFAI